MPETTDVSANKPLLYITNLSTFGARLRLVCAFTGEQLTETAPPDGAGSEAMKSISYFGKIPAIVADDRTMIESLPLMEYLVERAGGHALVPADISDRAVMRGLMTAHDNHVLGAIWPMFLQIKRSDPDLEIIKGALEAASKQYAVLASMFSTQSAFAVGREISLADLAIIPFSLLNGVMYTKFGVADPFAANPRLAQWKEQVMANPKVSETMNIMTTAIQRVFG